MGQLVDGTWKTTEALTSSDGAFERKPVTFRNWITADGRPGPSGDGGFPAEAGRYHLFVSLACPWAHRTLLYRALRGLTDLIDVDVVHPYMFDDGWTFATDFPGATGDSLFGGDFLREIYQRADPRISARVTVPILWDKTRGTIVSNESSEIIRMFDNAFDALTGNTDTFTPTDVMEDIEAINERVYNTLNNGVYRCGFARSQSAYDTAVDELFETLDWLEELLSSRRYLTGDRVTEADWRLLPTLLRFDPVYHHHFKCSRRRIVEYPALWGYARELYQWPGVTTTVHWDHIRHHYFRSHRSINPYGIIPLEPAADWAAPHGRG